MISRSMIVMLVAVVVAAGCGDGDRRSVYPASGKVVDAAGKPLAGATLVFHPVAKQADDNRHKPGATTDEEGNYKLTTYTENDGAPPGEYVVTIEWRPGKITAGGPQPPDKLKGKYAAQESSTIKVTIEKKTNELPPIQLR